MSSARWIIADAYIRVCSGELLQHRAMRAAIAAEHYSGGQQVARREVSATRVRSRRRRLTSRGIGPADRRTPEGGMSCEMRLVRGPAFGNVDLGILAIDRRAFRAVVGAPPVLRRRVWPRT